MLQNSTSAFPPKLLFLPDLDTRPAPMARETINMWIQACPSCGYCAPDISKMVEKAPEIIRSDSYQQQLNNPEFPKLANRFLCYSLLQESAGDYATAGWGSPHAAWACDDEGNRDSAKKCRMRAFTLFKKAKENNQSFAKQNGKEETIIVDLLRRTGQFEEALKICEEELKSNYEEKIMEIFQFQAKLISEEDIRSYSISEMILRDVLKK